MTWHKPVCSLLLLLLLPVGLIRAVIYIRCLHESVTSFTGKVKLWPKAQRKLQSHHSRPFLSPKRGMIRGRVPRQSAPITPSDPFNISHAPPWAASKERGEPGDGTERLFHHTWRGSSPSDSTRVEIRGWEVGFCGAIFQKTSIVNE